MNGDFSLAWALLTVSLFDTVIPFWLGWMVLLNAQRRDWAVWLVGGALCAYPPDAKPPALPGDLLGQCDSPRRLCVPLDPARSGGAVWAVPLWRERGLVGFLFLGEKGDRGLYSEEEMQIARAAGERLIDTQATASLARRLMMLQRRRLSESQVVDQRARRALHDDVLPRLHAAMLALSAQPAGADGPAADVLQQLAGVHHRLSALLRELPAPAAGGVGVLGAIGALKQSVEGDLRGAFDRVEWHVDPEVERRAAALAPVAAEVLYGAAREAIRNAGMHGRGADAGRRLELRVRVSWRQGFEVVVEDDGVGITGGGEACSEGGHGLVLHGTLMAVVGGALAVESALGQGTRVVLTLPSECPWVAAMDEQASSGTL